MHALRKIGFVEECWFLYGFRIGNKYYGCRKYHSKGTGASVDFDWEKAFDTKVIGWYHSHPGDGFISPSTIDHITMRSWVRSMGRPMLCGITSGSIHRCYEFFREKEGHPQICYRLVAVKMLGDFFVITRDEDAIPWTSKRR